MKYGEKTGLYRFSSLYGPVERCCEHGDGLARPISGWTFIVICERPSAYRRSLWIMPVNMIIWQAFWRGVHNGSLLIWPLDCVWWRFVTNLLILWVPVPFHLKFRCPFTPRCGAFSSSSGALSPHVQMPFHLKFRCPFTSRSGALSPHFPVPFHLKFRCAFTSISGALSPQVPVPFHLSSRCPFISRSGALSPQVPVPFHLKFWCPFTWNSGALSPEVPVPFHLKFRCPFTSSSGALSPQVPLCSSTFFFSSPSFTVH